MFAALSWSYIVITALGMKIGLAPPLQDARGQLDPSTGRWLYSQWFEKVRLTYDPELARIGPLSVLHPPLTMGFVGRERLAQLDIDWKASLDQRRDDQVEPDECKWQSVDAFRLFDNYNVGHYVCNEAADDNGELIQTNFLKTYDPYGSDPSGVPSEPPPIDSQSYIPRPYLGSPLTSAQPWTINGRRIIVQWFDYGRLEFDPEHPELGVQFGDVAKEVWVNLNAAKPTPFEPQ